MALTLLEVLGGAPGKWRARMQHGDNQVIADLKVDNPRDKLGQLLFVEIDIGGVMGWAKSKDESGIFTLPDGHRLIGEIDDNMPLEDGSFLYDLYISVGPEYFAIDSNDIQGAVLNTGDRIAIDVTGLCFNA